MAYSIVQTGNKNTGTAPVTATFGSIPTAGNLVLCSINSNSATAPTSVQDGNGNTLIQLNSASNGALGCFLYCLVEPPSPNTSSKNIVVTAGSDTLYVTIYEYSGNNARKELITDFNSAAGSTQATSTTGDAASTNGNQPTVTTSNPGDLIFNSIALNGTSGSLPTIGSPFTALLENPSTGGGNNTVLDDAYDIRTTTGTPNPHWTWTNTREWIQLCTALVPEFAVLQRDAQFGSSGTATMGFFRTNTAGNAIVVIAFINDNTSNLGISDTAGNTYSILATNYNSTDNLGFTAWIAYNILNTSNSVTVTASSGNFNIEVYEISGLASYNTLDVYTYQYQSSSTTPSSGSVTTTNANDLLIGASCQVVGAGGYVVGGGYFNIISSINDMYSASEEQFTTSAGSYTSAFILGGNTSVTLTILLALSPTPIGSPTTTSLLPMLGVG